MRLKRDTSDGSIMIPVHIWPTASPHVVSLTDAKNSLKDLEKRLPEGLIETIDECEECLVWLVMQGGSGGELEDGRFTIFEATIYQVIPCDRHTHVVRAAAAEFEEWKRCLNG